MCQPADKLLVDAAWLIGGPAHIEWCRNDVAEQLATNPPFGRKLGRLWAPLLDGWIPLDSCIADEVLWLNGQGVKTECCCCGHATGYTVNAYISVEEYDYVGAARMRELGYEHQWIRLKGAKPEPFVFLPRW